LPKKDKRVDDYIAKAPAFSKPILVHIRSVVHEACPDVEETIKWGSPHFDHDGMMCAMAAFKEHCGLRFWKSSLVLGPAKNETDSAGDFGKLVTIADLPPRKTLLAYVKKAAALNEEGTRVDRPKRVPKPEIEVPDYIRTALRKNKKAQTAFDAFSASHRREYVEWITEAKTDATRDKRLETALEWMTEGKSRNWKYQR
jgi:uncharacterized protein YdeI (YjbR/CyaY-like superfamily)